MPTLSKWIITIVVVLFAVYIYSLDKKIVPYWMAPLFALALFGLWLMEDPGKKKKKISAQKLNRKRKRENIFLLMIIVVIVIMVILKFDIW